jgi:hypothetical protein
MHRFNKLESQFILFGACCKLTSGMTLFERILCAKGSWGSLAELENVISFWI